VTESVGGEAGALARGCSFLRARQLPSGELPTCFSSDLADDGAWRYDPTVFATSVIALCLESVPNPDAALVVRRAVSFLRAQMRAPGLWRFWTSEHEFHRVIPFDSDDTACAAALLRGHGGAPAAVGGLLLANRDRRGLFHTWFVPHRGTAPRHLGFWRAAVGGWRRPLHRAAFWRLTEADPGDVDAVVNANVLFFLGETAATRPVVEHLAEVVREGREEDCDKWYRRSLAVHHAIARCFARGVAGLGPVREAALARILALARSDGSFGDGALDTALAACALGDWGYDGPELAAARAWLARSQLPSGGWATDAYYLGGPKAVSRWGSEEMTAGFALQALAPAVTAPSET
jgi:hypothetical protein